MSFPPQLSKEAVQAQLTRYNLRQLDDTTRRTPKYLYGSDRSTGAHYGLVPASNTRYQQSTVTPSVHGHGSYHPGLQQGKRVPGSSAPNHVPVIQNRKRTGVKADTPNTPTKARAASSSFFRMKEWLVDNAVDKPMYPKEFYDPGYDVSLSDSEGEGDEHSPSLTGAKKKPTDVSSAKGFQTTGARAYEPQTATAMVPTASSASK